MGKVIESPVKLFPGSVELLDPIPYPQFIEWENGVQRMTEATADVKADKITQGECDVIAWREIFKVVEVWNIPNFDMKNPPATPRTPVLLIMAWLTREIGKIINGEPDTKK